MYRCTGFLASVQVRNCDNAPVYHLSRKRMLWLWFFKCAVPDFVCTLPDRFKVVVPRTGAPYRLTRKLSPPSLWIVYSRGLQKDLPTLGSITNGMTAFFHLLWWYATVSLRLLLCAFPSSFIAYSTTLFRESSITISPSIISFSSEIRMKSKWYLKRCIFKR